MSGFPAGRSKNGKKDYNSDLGATRYESKLKEEVGEEDDDDEDDFGFVEMKFDQEGRRQRDNEDDPRDPHQQEQEQQSPYMLFDFRRGKDGFPSFCSIVDSARADELLQKQTKILSLNPLSIFSPRAPMTFSEISRKSLKFWGRESSGRDQYCCVSMHWYFLFEDRFSIK